MQDAVEPVQFGKKRGRRGVEVAEDIVFDQRDAMRFGELQQPVGRGWRHRTAGRVMQSGIGYIEFRSVFAGCSRKGFEVRAGMGIGHPDQFYTVCQKHGLKVEVAGIIDQNRIARLQQITADQVDGLRAGIGQQYFSARNVDALFTESVSKVLAQGAEPERFAIGGNIAPLVASNRAHRPADRFLWKPRVG